MPTFKWLKSGWNYYYFKDAPVHISSITLNKSMISFNSAWQTGQLTATVTPDDAVEKHVFWHSSDITVATVNSNWLVTCVTPGECVITASCDWVSATCSVVEQSYIDILVVWWGWNWWKACQFNNYYYSWWGGGWWCVIEVCGLIIEETISSYDISVWWVQWSSCFSDILVAPWWCEWSNVYRWWWASGSWCIWWNNQNACRWWWGGWASENWYGSLDNNRWWKWICSSISWSNMGYWWWWGWWWYGCSSSWDIKYWWEWMDGWWNWWQGKNGNNSTDWCPATYYWWWWGGGWLSYSGFPKNWWAWCQWIVIIRYKTDWSYWLTNATGWCKYTCGDYTIHCFTSDWTFCIIW